MNQQQIVRQLRALKDSLESLRRSVEKSAASIQSLSAEIARLEADLSETETHQCDLSDQPIITYDDNYTLVTIATVHGVTDTIRVPRRKL